MEAPDQTYDVGIEITITCVDVSLLFNGILIELISLLPIVKFSYTFFYTAGDRRTMLLIFIFS